MTSAELCNVLGISASTLKRWRRDGLPFEPWSRSIYRYSLREVLTWRADRYRK